MVKEVKRKNLFRVVFLCIIVLFVHSCGTLSSRPFPEIKNKLEGKGLVVAEIESLTWNGSYISIKKLDGKGNVFSSHSTLDFDEKSHIGVVLLAPGEYVIDQFSLLLGRTTYTSKINITFTVRANHITNLGKLKPIAYHSADEEKYYKPKMSYFRFDNTENAKRQLKERYPQLTSEIAQMSKDLPSKAELMALRKSMTENYPYANQGPPFFVSKLPGTSFLVGDLGLLAKLGADTPKVYTTGTTEILFPVSKLYQRPLIQSEFGRLFKLIESENVLDEIKKPEGFEFANGFRLNDGDILLISDESKIALADAENETWRVVDFSDSDIKQLTMPSLAYNLKRNKEQNYDHYLAELNQVTEDREWIYAKIWHSGYTRSKAFT